MDKGQSIEAEYVALSTSCAQVIWMRTQLQDYGFNYNKISLYSESEYVAVSGYCASVLWMRTQLTDYGFFYDKVPIYCDSNSAIAISCNPVQHARTKHIDVRSYALSWKPCQGDSLNLPDHSPNPQSPNNERKASSIEDGSGLYSTIKTVDTAFNEYQEESVAETHFDDNSLSEDNIQSVCSPSQSRSIFHQNSKTDSSLFIFHKGPDTAYLLLYVDDIILIASSASLLQRCLATCRSTSGYYVFLGDNLLTWSSKRQDTLSRSSVEAEYRGIANVVALSSWIRHLLRELHTLLFIATLVYCDNVSVVYIVLRYLKGSPGLDIQFDKVFDLRLRVISYADWEKCLKTRKFVTSFCVYLGKSLVSWKRKKQDTFSNSSTKAEYRSMTSATYETISLVSWKRKKQDTFSNSSTKAEYRSMTSATYETISLELVYGDGSVESDWSQVSSIPFSSSLPLKLICSLLSCNMSSGIVQCLLFFVAFVMG
nr:NBS-containing resistance-like protein [Tanacetum cinerariifolium]